MLLLLVIAQPPEGPCVAGVAVPLGVEPWCELRHDLSRLNEADDDSMRFLAEHYARFFTERRDAPGPAEGEPGRTQIARRRLVEEGFAYQAQRTGNFYACHGGRAYHVLAAAPDDATLDDVYRHYVIEGRPPDEPLPGAGEQPGPSFWLLSPGADPRVIDVTPPWPHEPRQVGADEFKTLDGRPWLGFPTFPEEEGPT